jgi:predicted ATPase
MGDLVVSQADRQADTVGSATLAPRGRTEAALLGRDVELAALDTMLADGERRLITIVGSGGVGKTSLARALAERQTTGPRFAEVRFVDLAPLASHEQLVPTLATALGLGPDAGNADGRSQRKRLLDGLAPRSLLLVLDNFEQLLDGAELLAEITHAAPAVAVLVTSRERLGLHIEQLLTLQGLAVPLDASPAQVASSPSAQLFLRAVRRVVHDFAVTPEDALHLTTICQLVAGLPLAIELAATWAEVLPLAVVASEIRQGIDLLATEAVDLPERQRSIRAVCAASWQRLDPDEQRLFVRLAVFRGGFTREAAQEIAGASTQGLARLAHRSLLTYDRGQERYHLHELLRQYAAEQLARDAGGERETRDSHAAYFCGLLTRLTPELRGPRQQETVTSIQIERENVRAAWLWAGADGRYEDLARAADCVGYVWKWQAAFEDGLSLFGGAADWLERTLPEPDAGGCLLALALLRAWQSNFARLLGRRVEAERLLTRAVDHLDTAEPAGDDTRRVRAFALMQLGQAAHNAGRLEAQRLYEQSRDAYDTPDTRWEQSAALLALGHLAHDQGAFAEAEERFAASLAIRQACGDQRGVAYVLELWSQTAAEAGRSADAEALARRSNALYQALGDQVSSATGLGKLGVIQMWLGDYATAYSTLATSLAQYQQLGNRAATGRARCRLGLALGALGRYDEAHAEVQVGMEMLRKIGKPLDLAWGQWVAGIVLLGMGTLPEAEAAFKESVGHYRDTGQVGQAGWPLALLAHVVLERGDEVTARSHLLEILHESRGRRDFLPLIEALPTAARLLARRGRAERAVELVALAWRYPVLTSSQVYTAILSRAHAEASASLPDGSVTAATARGRGLDPWRTAEALADELFNTTEEPPGTAADTCPVRLDEEARELLVADQRVGLAPLEFAVLRYLAEREGKAVSRAALLADVWGYSYEGGSNVVDAVVRALRKKLGAYAAALETVTKVGYRYRHPT